MMFHIIWLRKGEVYISKKIYPDWETIQNEFDDYMTSLSFNMLEELKACLAEEYPMHLIIIEKAVLELNNSTDRLYVLLPV